MPRNNVCRAITFINFHIPLRWNNNITIQYTTIGFFDGLFTKRIDINYQNDDLIPLWKYIGSKTAENEGYYSYQNVFGFSRDSWNIIDDDTFWNQSTDENFPLTFVVFLQVKDYMIEDHTIENQCKAFNEKINNQLQDRGKSYVYSTIDKNDFIVCIKSKDYSETVTAIKKLHDAGVKVVYSYTIFSVNKEILENLDDEKYRYLFDEKIPSICLKGISNSFESGEKITLDRKYRQFCDRLIQKLYQPEDSAAPVNEDDNKVLYDILGDNDFRLIARNVSLGRILREYASGGILCYTEKLFPYYLFSSSLVLNTKTGPQERINDAEIEDAINIMREKFTCNMCDNLSEQMTGIIQIVKNSAIPQEDCVTTFCHAVFQLLQSLKVLETAPTKKYDFCSLYLPLEALIHILESKIDNPDLGNNKMIYEFIHKISMTLHGTLRTDIQFFQIRDFNVIVHYAPAKIRAFYALWAMKIRDFYRNLVLNHQTPMHEYSFILAPGMYKGTAVRQLFEDTNAENHLMLITLPERHIYSPRWITIILAHEVSHFVGSTIRNRPERHRMWLSITSRILELELQSLFYQELLSIPSDNVVNAYKENPVFLFQINKMLTVSEERIRQDNWNGQKNIYHSEKSIKIIMESYRMFLQYYAKQILCDFCCNIRDSLSNSCQNSSGVISRDDLRDICNEITNDMMDYCDVFGKLVLEDFLSLIKYLTAEAFADIMAILTLELSPIDYIRSFVKTELAKNEGEISSSKTVTAITIRISLVTMAIVNVFKSMPQSKLYFHNYDVWVNESISAFTNSSSTTEHERNIAKGVMTFLNRKRNLSLSIDNYTPIYDCSTHSFKGGRDDFLKDEIIFNLICDYLEESARLYLDIVIQSDDIMTERRDILRTYGNISNNSEIELMEEIETFLSDSEKKYMQ